MEDVSKMTVQERADKIGCMIKAEVDAGRFKMSSGFIAAGKGNSCRGCAIGSLAFALGCRDTYAGRGTCHSFIEREAGDLISQDERLQLEMGYEAWSVIGFGCTADADPSSPFFQLGKKMGLASGYRTERMYELLARCLRESNP